MIVPSAVRGWRYSHPGLDIWRDHLGADYVLVSIFLDGQNTTGRSVSNVLRRASAAGSSTRAARDWHAWST